MFLWLKFFHIFFIVAWFAGLFYLPRIFVNLAMAEGEGEYARLLLMAQKLYRFMQPWCIGALVCGLAMPLFAIGFTPWVHAKLPWRCCCWAIICGAAGCWRGSRRGAIRIPTAGTVCSTSCPCFCCWPPFILLCLNRLETEL